MLIFHWFFHYFRYPKGSQVEVYVEVYVGAKLEFVLGSTWIRFDIDLGSCLGSQNARKTTSKRSKMGPRRLQDGRRRAKFGAKTAYKMA